MRQRRSPPLPPVSIEKLDATAREICRLFTERSDAGALALIAGLENKIEIAFVVAFAADRMAPTTRTEFVKFLEQQVSK